MELIVLGQLFARIQLRAEGIPLEIALTSMRAERAAEIAVFVIMEFATVSMFLGAGAPAMEQISKIMDVVAEIPFRQITATIVPEIALAAPIHAERAEVSVTLATTESADVLTGMAADVAILQILML